MADITDWMSLGQPSVEWEAAMKQLPSRPNLGTVKDIRTLREYFIEQKRKANLTFEPTPGVIEKDVEIPTRDGARIAAKVYSPEGKSGLPIAVLYHGGGWCIGGLENEEFLCNKIAGELEAVAVNVDYRLAPEHQFPTAVYDGVDAAKWAVANASSYGGDATKGFVVGGSSAGANIAAVVALTLKDETYQPPITGALLKIPSLCAVTAVPDKLKAEYRSWDQNEHADILSRDACNLFSNNYAPNEEDRKSPLFSPLIWPTGFERFPASYFQICGADPLRDEGLIFERILREEHGTATNVKVYPGFPHGFSGVAPMLPSSRRFNNESVEGVKWLLSR